MINYTVSTNFSQPFIGTKVGYKNVIFTELPLRFTKPSGTKNNKKNPLFKIRTINTPIKFEKNKTKMNILRAKIILIYLTFPTITLPLNYYIKPNSISLNTFNHSQTKRKNKTTLMTPL